MTDSQFDKFIGRKVLVTESSKKMYFNTLKKEIDYLVCTLDPSETVVAELQEETGNQNIRVWLPGSAGTMDYKLSRLNIHIVKQADGSFAVDRINFG